jgi:MFS family permease
MSEPVERLDSDRSADDEEAGRVHRTGHLRVWFLGPRRLAPLTITHCVHSAAEAFFTVSLAGSIFFSVSPDAARPRVLLFLVLTLAPFLVMAPLVGPLVDRVRGGLAGTMVATFGLRAVLAIFLAEHLRTLLLFPLAFGILVVAKTYTVSRNALTPAFVDDEQDLVGANARLSRSATIVGAVAAGGAVWLYSATSGAWTLRVAAILYLVGVWVSWRVRTASPPIERVEPDALLELDRPDVSSAVWDMMVLRAAIGFALFQFGFSLRSSNEPAWVLGTVILANGVGGFLGTIVSPFLRRHLTERSMFTIALVAPTLAMIVCGLLFNRVTLVASVFVLGLSVSIGRRALDSTIQTQAPHARRGRVYAGLETRLELVWVLAACLAVALRVATWIGVLALAGFLGVVTVLHLRRRDSLRILRPITVAPLPERLLIRAETLAAQGYFDEAIIVAEAAEAAATRPSPGGHDASSSEGTATDLRARAAETISRARRRIEPVRH